MSSEVLSFFLINPGFDTGFKWTNTCLCNSGGLFSPSDGFVVEPFVCLISFCLASTPSPSFYSFLLSPVGFSFRSLL